ncbi:zinc finger (CCCH type) motif-containing protein [Cardiosporidium cionae]|uniref:Zinc finger (CCCH type) motif-containing protein n=1 Tax=Cardiosporidium cionae TaxID=476202 RepID=A0ABQ7JA21_9APIC|nr:zinc finger (CCCH type) motif-containing protein [Cardiosporidium cionae]|eukprot:KAF8820851.1 zinc finger (CCCH type) motif-containing protein [Cardiosporidium cionae]
MCSKGKFCTFVHHPDEQREHPDLKKTKICELWERGCCIHQDFPEKCRFAHGDEDLKRANSALCVKHMRGDCGEEKCQYAHHIDEISTAFIYRQRNDLSYRLSPINECPIAYEE